MAKAPNWLPGQSGNPAGRRPGTGEVSKLRVALGERVPEVLEAMVQRAIQGDVGAARLILERVVPPLKGREQAVVLALPDGTEDDIPPYNLRCACPCAACVDEYTGQPLLDPNAIPSDIQPQSIQPLGNYAISIAWSDGHSSGIFAWDFLKQFAQRLARANA